MELEKKRTPWRSNPSITGQLKSSLAKKTAVRDKVKNTRAKKALRKAHPKSLRKQV